MAAKPSEPPKPLTDWTFYDKCTCGGVLKYKYRNSDYPGIQIDWWVKYYKFEVENKGLKVVRQTPLTQLESYLFDLKQEFKILNAKKTIQKEAEG